MSIFHRHIKRRNKILLNKREQAIVLIAKTETINNPVTVIVDVFIEDIVEVRIV